MRLCNFYRAYFAIYDEVLLPDTPISDHIQPMLGGNCLRLSTTTPDVFSFRLCYIAPPLYLQEARVNKFLLRFLLPSREILTQGLAGGQEDHLAAQ
jgi:hypothetical protein